jgi:hypothetical protein
MKFTAEQIAGILEGEVIGNPNAEVHVLSKIEEGKEGSLTFCQTQNTTITFIAPKLQSRL